MWSYFIQIIKYNNFNNYYLKSTTKYKTFAVT